MRGRTDFMLLVQQVRDRAPVAPTTNGLMSTTDAKAQNSDRVNLIHPMKTDGPHTQANPSPGYL
ncbi:hypothetical protein KDAU_13700 [Dictyobacter aurantiacus]|uniref:Uncharacterized protein n=1 Tax=Dictyobacter aurantiacus TaxID=1936993 RepID=A0A401ZAX5_9CHLR|nr:hypothetical protein KDAU_13700 [Dictyobacter aurantiacus]